LVENGTNRLSLASGDVGTLCVKDSARNSQISGEKRDLKMPIGLFEFLVPLGVPQERESVEHFN
jgi:hypothetical protein